MLKLVVLVALVAAANGASCPARCSTCFAGGAGGGTSLVGGVCHASCSASGYCGTSDAYTNGGTDCTGCAETPTASQRANLKLADAHYVTNTKASIAAAELLYKQTVVEFSALFNAGSLLTKSAKMRYNYLLAHDSRKPAAEQALLCEDTCSPTGQWSHMSNCNLQYCIDKQTAGWCDPNDAGHQYARNECQKTCNICADKTPYAASELSSLLGRRSNDQCSDGVQNGDETGVDCGGSSCSVCPDVAFFNANPKFSPNADIILTFDNTWVPVVGPAGLVTKQGILSTETESGAGRTGMVVDFSCIVDSYGRVTPTEQVGAMAVLDAAPFQAGTGDWSIQMDAKGTRDWVSGVHGGYSDSGRANLPAPAGSGPFKGRGSSSSQSFFDMGTGANPQGVGMGQYGQNNRVGELCAAPTQLAPVCQTISCASGKCKYEGHMCSGGKADKMLVNFATSQIELGGVGWSNSFKGTRPHPQNWHTYTLVKQGNKVGLFINGIQHMYVDATTMKALNPTVVQFWNTGFQGWLADFEFAKFAKYDVAETGLPRAASKTSFF